MAGTVGSVTAGWAQRRYVSAKPSLPASDTAAKGVAKIGTRLRGGALIGAPCIQAATAAADG